jgi:hypothetical protein
MGLFFYGKITRNFFKNIESNKVISENIGGIDNEEN